MKCPRCKDKGIPSETGNIATGVGKFDYIIACWACAWQVASYQLEAWIARWRN